MIPFDNYLFFALFSASSTLVTILHDLEKNHKKQDADSQTVKKVGYKSYSLKI
jgi:hypothetical protein